MIRDNKVSYDNFRRIIMNYDKTGSGYVAPEQLKDIFTGLQVNISTDQFDQLA